jgi:hypothetical protein
MAAAPPRTGGRLRNFGSRIWSVSRSFLPRRGRSGENFIHATNERFAILDSAGNVTGIYNPNDSGADNRQGNPQQNSRSSRTAANGLHQLSQTALGAVDATDQFSFSGIATSL